MSGYSVAWITVGGVLLAGVAFVAAGLGANRLLRPPSRPFGAALEPYQCGVVVAPDFRWKRVLTWD